MKKHLWLCVGVFWLVACADPELVCRDPVGCVVLGANEPIRIATLLALSGEVAYLGEDALGGIEIALEDRDNQLLGHPVELVNRDVGCSAATPQSIVDELTADVSLVAVLGPTCSHSVTALLPTVSQSGLLMISPSATDTMLTLPPIEGGVWQVGYFRTIPSSAYQAEVAAEFAYHTMNARKAAVIHDGGPYAGGIQHAFVDTFRKLGGVVTYQTTMPVGETGVKELVNGATTSVPDVIYLALFEPEAGLFANQLIEMADSTSITLIGPDSLLVPSFPAGAGLAVNSMYVTGTAVFGSAYNTFLTKWNRYYDHPPPANFHAFAYDATNILLEAIESVAQVGNTGVLVIGRGALREAVAETADFRGLTGSITCHEFGDCASKKAVGIYQFTTAEVSGQRWPPLLIDQQAFDNP